MVRAKFKLTETTDMDWGTRENPKPVRSLTFQAVNGGSAENEKFFAASPNGTIKLGCANMAAAEQFQINHEYYVDFTPAE